MYRDLDKNEDKLSLIEKSKYLLSNKEECLKFMLKVSNEWIISTKVNFSNSGQNRRAWIGQASCCYAYNVPEYLTREAWMLLSEDSRIQANLIADRVILRWELINLLQLNGKKFYK